MTRWARRGAAAATVAAACCGSVVAATAGSERGPGDTQRIDVPAPVIAAQSDGAGEIRAQRGRAIRGRFGYGRRYKKRRPIPPSRFGRPVEVEEENRRFPQAEGPLPGPRGGPSAEDNRDPQFRPGRRTDDPKVPLPPYPETGKALPRTATVYKTGPPVSAAASNDFTITRNNPVVQGGGFTSTTAEPSFANDQDVVLFTGNKHAHVSEDNGINWDDIPLVDAAAGRPDEDGGICCDQIAYAVDYSGERLIFHLLLYYQQGGGPTQGSGNTVRLQVYHGGEEVVSQQGQCTYDFKAEDMEGADNFTGGEWIDSPKMAATERYLYMTGNVFRNAQAAPGQFADTFAAGRVWRMRISDLAETDCSQPLPWTYWHGGSVDDGSNVPVQGAETADVMHIGQLAVNGATQVMRLFTVHGTRLTMGLTTNTISPFLATEPGQAVCTTPGPTVSNPCGHSSSDGWPETGWFAHDGTMGFMWNVKQGGGYSFPYVQMARFSWTSPFLSLIDEPDIDNSEYAWHYGAAGINQRGHVGLVAYNMGGGKNPSPAATLVDDIDPGWSGMSFHRIVRSDDGPSEDRWGDYGTVRYYDDCPNMFGTAVYSLQGGPNHSDSEHRFAIFGRERDECADLTALQAEARTVYFDPTRPIDLVSRAAMRNTGTGSASGSSPTWFLSRDLELSASDIRLKSQTSAVPQLAAGDGAGVVARSDIPSRASGNYYLITCLEPPEGMRQVSRSNDCTAARESLYVARSRREVGIRDFRVRPPRGVQQTPTHAVSRRGRVNVGLDLVSGSSPSDRIVQLYTSRRARFSRRAKLVRSVKLGRRTRAREPRTQQFRVKTRLRLPRSTRRGRRYQLIACTVRRRGARPSARKCLAARQQLLVKRRR